MVVVQSVIRLVTSDGKVSWEPSPSLITTVGGERFIKISQKAKGFAKIVAHNCPQPCSKQSVASSIGYRHVMSLRQEALLADLAAEDRENVPALFQGFQAEPAEEDKPKLTKKEVEKRRPLHV